MKTRFFLKNCLCVFTLITVGVATAQTTPPSTFVTVKNVQKEYLAPRLSRIRNASTNLWTFNAVDSYDSAWHTEVFYITSFVIGGNPPQKGQLIELDYKRDRARVWTIPTGIGSWAILKGHDGNLYMGSYFGGELLCFDPKTKTWISLPQASAAFRKNNSIITDIVQSPDGDIYYGTYPGAHLVRYNPHRHTVTDLGKVADEKYVRWMAVTPSGIVLCGVGPKHGRVIAYNPRTRRFRTITPARYQTPGVFSKPLASNQYVLECQHSPGGKILVYNPVSLKFLREYTVPLKNNGSGNQSIFTLVDPTHVLYQDNHQRLMELDVANGKRSVLFAHPGTAANNRWYFDSKGNLLGLLVQDYVYLNRNTGQVTQRPIPIPHPGQNILWLNTAPDGTIYGGPEFGQTMFAFNPHHHRLISYDQVVDRTGEIYYGTFYHGKVYDISYAEAALTVFDPKKRWHPGDSPDSNPRTILFMGKSQYRAIGGIHLGPGNKLYLGTQPDYGLLGGALSVFNPTTDKIHIMRNLIPEEEIGAVATGRHYVYGEADPGGGMGSTPRASFTHFFVWDPRTHRIVFDHRFPPGERFDAIAVVHGHAYFVAGKNIMDYNAAQHRLTTLLRMKRAANVPPESLKATRNGTLFGIFGHSLGSIHLTTKTLHLYPATQGYATSGLAIGKHGTIYFGSYTDLGIYHPASPSGPAAFGN